MTRNVPRHALGEVVGDRAGRLGAVLALASLPAHLLLPPTISHQLATLVLALMAGVYLGFAVQDGRARVLVIEGLVASAFVAAALLGLWVSAWAVPAAYVLHGFWDLAHHRHVSTAMPAWYVPFCAVFDWVFAAGLVANWLIR